jgi:NTP pyrophosphatase (non-canonical NTP hydrolase)
LRLELFQWVTPNEASLWKDVPSKVRSIGEELADIIICCLSMANTMQIDVTKVVTKKLERNEIKYPVEKYLGKAHVQ